MSERSHDLPPELAVLEQTLRGGLADMEPEAAVRGRVLAAVGRELRAVERRQFWQYAAAVAAVFLVAFNVSFSAAANTSRPAIGPDHHKLPALREAIRQMDLDLTEDEITRQCILLIAGDELLPMGRPYAPMNLRASSQ